MDTEQEITNEHDAIVARVAELERERDALLEAAQGMYKLHKDGVSHQLQLYERAEVLEVLRATYDRITRGL
jgi:hypothetical protein